MALIAEGLISLDEVATDGTRLRARARGGSMTVVIPRMEHDAAGLRALASRKGDAKVARRLLALAMVMDGSTRTDAARATGMDRQTLRDSLHRYNESGVAGLSNQPHAGDPEPRLNPEEKAQLAAWLRQGPGLEEDGLVRWRLSDLGRRILDRFFVLLDERSVGRMLKAMRFSHISMRPQNPKADTDAQQTHKKTAQPSWRASPRRRCAISPSNAGGRMKPGSASKAA